MINNLIGDYPDDHLAADTLSKLFLSDELNLSLTEIEFSPIYYFSNIPLGFWIFFQLMQQLGELSLFKVTQSGRI